MSLEEPGVFYFEPGAAPPELLHTFQYSTWEKQSAEFKASLSPALARKLRQLTLITMAMGVKAISYEDAAERLEIPMGAIELFLVEALLDKAVRGKVNATTGKLYIYSCATRNCSPEQVKDAAKTLDAFQDRLEAVIQANMARLRQASGKRRRANRASGKGATPAGRSEHK